MGTSVPIIINFLMLQIKKRNGELVAFNPTKILNRIKKAAKGLKVNSDQIFINVITSVPTEGIISTTEIDSLVANVAAPYTATHPDYSKLAATVAISSLHKDINLNMYETMKSLAEEGVVNQKLVEIMEQYGPDNIQAVIDYDNNDIFNFFGWKTLENMYLLKNSEGKVVESPQQMYMRVALWVTNSFDEAKELYQYLSKQLISCATPIMINAGTKNAQLASCVLHYNNGDSRIGLLETLNDISNYSSSGAGIGLCMSNIRSKDSRIKSSGGKAGGLLRYLKIVNEALRFFNQQGRRPGVAAIYLEPWHKDIFDLLDLKKNTGSEEMRAKDLFTALMIPDLFMREVKEDGDWYLFCPNQIKRAGLKAFDKIWGEEFEQEYRKAVELGIGKKVKAQDILKKIIESQIETGVPYILFKDHINRKSNHINYGVVKQSNLCAEIVQYTDEEITAICTLSSMVLKNFLNGKDFDFKELEKAVRLTVRALNKVIDINAYATDKGRIGGLKQRAIAIGVQGLADTIYLMDYTYTSEEARQLNKDIFETIYFAAIDESNKLCQEGVYKPYDGFKGSPISEGKFQFNMWGLTSADLSGRYDWDALVKNVMEYGVCNSMFTGQMPTASSSNATESFEMTEVQTSNLFNRRVIGGEILIINKYLVNDLEKLGLWNENVKNEIIINDGSIQNINFLKYIDEEEKNYERKVKKIEHIIEKYKTIWEHKQKDLINMAADRGIFIDQTQSMNIYMAEPTMKKLSSSMLYSWEKGLKTGSYYVRTKAISTGAKHLAIDVSNNISAPVSKIEEPVIIQEVIDKPANSPFDCEGCSA